MRFIIAVKDINELSPVDVVAIYTRLSWSDSGSDSSIQKELHKRYIEVEPVAHPEMAMALIWVDDVLAGWVGSRPWPEKFKGDPITAQTVECFVDPEFRRKGIAKMGLHALIAAGKIDRNDFVSVYEAEVVKLAEACGCKTVLLCES
jgi:GNAT superfamily N-acetyltransferase